MSIDDGDEQDGPPPSADAGGTDEEKGKVPPVVAVAAAAAAGKRAGGKGGGNGAAEVDDAIARGVAAASATPAEAGGSSGGGIGQGMGPGAFPVRGISYAGRGGAAGGSAASAGTVEVVTATLVDEARPTPPPLLRQAVTATDPRGGDAPPLPMRPEGSFVAYAVVAEDGEGAATDAAADQWCSFTLADRRVQCCLALGLLTIVGLAFGLGLALGVGRDASAAPGTSGTAVPGSGSGSGSDPVSVRPTVRPPEPSPRPAPPPTASPAPGASPSSSFAAEGSGSAPSPGPTSSDPSPTPTPDTGTCYDVLRGNCVGDGCDFFRTVQPRTLAGCQAECEKRQNCVAFDHDRTDRPTWDGRCYLFRGGGCGSSDRDPDVRCRIARPCTEADADRGGSSSSSPGSTTWVPLGDAVWPRLSQEDDFGRAVAISADGTTVAASAPRRDGEEGRESGQVRVYRWSEEGSWRQLGSPIDGLAARDELGYPTRSIDLNGDGTVVAVGSGLHDGERGAVMVLQYLEGTDRWRLLGDLILGEPWDHSGYALALNGEGNVLVVGAFGHSGRDRDGEVPASGLVRAYSFEEGRFWEEVDGVIGEEFGELGLSVALSADGLTFAAGAPYDSGGGEEAGAVAVYRYDFESGELDLVGDPIRGEEDGDRLGIAVALSADASVIAVGADLADEDREEAVRVLRWSEDEGGWVQMGQRLERGGSVEEWFGMSVALSGDGTVLATIASELDGDEAFYVGRHCKVFRFDGVGDRWVQLEDISVDAYPSSMDISGDGELLVLGFPYDDDLRGGHVRVFKLE